MNEVTMEVRLARALSRLIGGVEATMPASINTKWDRERLESATIEAKRAMDEFRSSRRNAA